LSSNDTYVNPISSGLAKVARKDVTTLPARSHNSDPWPTPNSRLKLIAYLDRLAEGAGDPQIWMRITTAFRLSKDPGASFALASSLDAAIGMTDNLGFSGLGHVTKARPVIQAISVALGKIPEPTRLKLANAQFGTHRCTGSPAEFPLLCCFTYHIDYSISRRPTYGRLTTPDAGPSTLDLPQARIKASPTLPAGAAISDPLAYPEIAAQADRLDRSPCRIRGGSRAHPDVEWDWPAG
jgi:hypothetical protein